MPIARLKENHSITPTNQGIRQVKISLLCRILQFANLIPSPLFAVLSKLVLPTVVFLTSQPRTFPRRRLCLDLPSLAAFASTSPHIFSHLPLCGAVFHPKVMEEVYIGPCFAATVD
jgi:hypothetical protein